jgi:hypothetical protein
MGQLPVESVGRFGAEWTIDVIEDWTTGVRRPRRTVEM